MAVTSGLLTVAEFSRLPQAPGGIRQELHHGQVVEMPPVRKRHTRLQQQLVSLLSAAVNPAQYRVDKEFPFRPAEEYEVWVADVAVFGLSRWEETPDDDYFRGVPEIVIEVLSPSNTTSEMMDREEICLRRGGREFWLVDPERESVKVVRADGDSSVHGVLSVLDSAALVNSIGVRAIFAR
jgi:Uma2 family endonuclease